MAKTRENVFCERCEAVVNSSLVGIDTQRLTGKATYWRETPKMIYICDECALELSGLVDKWWLKKQRGKFNGGVLKA